MKFKGTVVLPVVTASPGSPAEGQLWYDSTAKRVKAYGAAAEHFIQAGFTHPILHTASWYDLLCHSGTFATQNIAKDRIYWLPFFPGHGGTLEEFGNEVTTGGTSSNVHRFGIWDGSTGIPGTLIQDFGTVSSTSTGAKTVTPAYVFTSRPYFLGMASQVGNAGTVRSTNVNCTSTPGMNRAAGPGSFPTSTNVPVGLVQDSVTGAFPGSATPSSTTNAQMPRMLIRVS